MHITHSTDVTAALRASERRNALLSMSPDRARAAERGGMRRGDGRRGGGGGAVAAFTGAVGIEGFTTTDEYRAAVATIVAGDAAGFFVCVAVHVLAVPTAAEVLCACGPTSTRGWVLWTSVASLRFRAANGVGTMVNSPVSSVVLGDVGYTLLLAAVHDGTTLRFYRKRAQIGAGNAIVGYTPASALDRISVGVSNAAASPASSFRIIGVMSGTGAPALADVQAWDAACQSANDIADIGGAGVTVTDRWRASGNNPPAATWTADAGGKALALTGSLTAVSFTPAYE